MKNPKIVIGCILLTIGISGLVFAVFQLGTKQDIYDQKIQIMKQTQNTKIAQLKPFIYIPKETVDMTIPTTISIVSSVTTIIGNIFVFWGVFSKRQKV